MPFLSIRRLGCWLLVSAAWLTSCGNANTPLDADTRYRIDSAATEQIRVASYALDTQCVYLRYHHLDALVDSFKQVRKRQIEEQLRTVPR